MDRPRGVVWARRAVAAVGVAVVGIALSGCAVHWTGEQWRAVDRQQARVSTAINAASSPTSATSPPTDETRLLSWLGDPTGAPWRLWRDGETVPDISAAGDVVVYDVAPSRDGRQGRSPSSDSTVAFRVLYFSGTGSSDTWGVPVALYTCEREQVDLRDGRVWSITVVRDGVPCPAALVDALPTGSAFVPPHEFDG